MAVAAYLYNAVLSSVLGIWNNLDRLKVFAYPSHDRLNQCLENYMYITKKTTINTQPLWNPPHTKIR
jgi:hypothetical protein